MVGVVHGVEQATVVADNVDGLGTEGLGTVRSGDGLGTEDLGTVRVTTVRSGDGLGTKDEDGLVVSATRDDVRFL